MHDPDEHSELRPAAQPSGSPEPAADTPPPGHTPEPEMTIIDQPDPSGMVDAASAADASESQFMAEAGSHSEEQHPQPEASGHSQASAANQQDTALREESAVSAGSNAPGSQQHNDDKQEQEQYEGEEDEDDPQQYFVPGMRAIDVEVDCGPHRPCTLIHVTIDVSTTAPKPFLGGYRHKLSGALYMHAATQTPRAQTQAAARQPKLCRTTQTVEFASRQQQTQREMGTQMERPGLLLDTSGDREMHARPYTTAAEVLARREAAALMIQRYTRGWFARLAAAALRRHNEERQQFIEQQQAAQQQAAADTRKREVERRMHPRTGSDFNILSGELEAWRQQELGKIKAAKLDEDKERMALQLLLAKETRLLQTIDRLRVNAKHENKSTRIHKELANMAQPKTWELRNGAKVLVHTPLTTRARELQHLYTGLTLDALTTDERLDVLLHVKWSVKEFECDLTRDIVALIDREADLLNRGRNPKTLEGLRKRLRSLFLAFCETPEFNPESTRFKIQPADNEQYVYEAPDAAQHTTTAAVPVC